MISGTAIKDVQTLEFYSESLGILLKKINDSKLAPQSDALFPENYTSSVRETLPSSNNACGVGIRGRANFSDIEESNDDNSDSSDDDIISTNKCVSEEKIFDNELIGKLKSSSIQKDATRVKNSQKKKKKNAKTKEELMKQMSSPPVSIIILGSELGETAVTSSNKNFTNALKIATSLLPPSQSHFDDSPLPPLISLHNLSKNLAQPACSKPDVTNLTLVLLLRSGRFAAAIFHQGTCLKHTTSTRYTARKGQGGAQSSNDNAKGKAKSVGSQLRRSGEIQLRKDVASVLQDWEQEIRKCALCFLSVSKTLQNGFWDDVDKILGNDHVCSLQKGADTVRSIPLDVGRPSFEACLAVYDLMMCCTIVKIDINMLKYQEVADGDEKNMVTEENEAKIQHNKSLKKGTTKVPEKVRVKFEDIPLTPLHEAARDGNLEKVLSLLPNYDDDDDKERIEELSSKNVNKMAGPKFMTPLHYAAESDPNTDLIMATKCISVLLLKGKANPTKCDSHGRTPYYLASNDSVRNAFRIARAELGEDIWDWDNEAKVGPPLTENDLQRKKEKTAEKKRRQRQRQKERKALERAKVEEAERRAKEEIEKAGLPKRKSDARKGTLCDFCQVLCSKRKSQMFSRLNFVYCGVDCVQKHKRELIAYAATARAALKTE